MYSLGEIAARLELEFSGRADRPVLGLAPLASARPQDLAFLVSAKYLADLELTRAAAVILPTEFAAQCPVDYLISDNPYASFARATQLFDPCPAPLPGVHPSADLAPGSKVHPTATIGANVVVEDKATIGAGAVIDAGCFIGRGSKVGANTRLYANVVMYHDVQLGDDGIVHSGTVLGSDGFGFAPSSSGWEKIYQLGGVRIGDRVEIGSNTSIDRGSLEHTVIEDGVIIDNLVHVAHNCHIGKNTAIAACCGVAGSTKIGANCTFAGQVGVVGHIEICDNAHFTGKTMVTKSVKEPGSYSSGTPMAPSRKWRKNAVRYSQLDDMQRRLKKLEKE